MKKHKSIFAKAARVQCNAGRTHETPEDHKSRKLLLKKMSRHSRTKR